MNIKGKIAVVTGAGSGIGQSIAKTFAQAGATVVIAEINEENGRNLEMEMKKEGYSSMYVNTDVSSSASVKSMIEQTNERFGRLDILVNNAGLEYFTTIEETTEEQWYKTMDVNLKGVFLGIKHAIPMMKKQGQGSIINIASVAGLSAWPGLGVYSAAKGGVVQLTKAAAVENGKYGIRVNSISPGAIRTPLLEEQYLGSTNDPAAVEAELLKRNPMKRFGMPEDIAGAALYLASEHSQFVTGHSLVVDGGLTSFVGELI
ncbi:SDR family NAD(P)-dependent oxidoreductase [Bacillus sp. B190/17]|uniref:SDR family NAD(P)-dependent oxidoreductase n=1 Tax=Bacillus lumedeiriae TaxID=3058829 RepID=A0ABW8I8D5_9BACI